MTQTITFRGASDDLLEVEGSLPGCDEYGVGSSHNWHYFVGSDGSVIALAYYPDGEGGWRAKRLVDGTASWAVTDIGDDDDPVEQGALTGELTSINFVGESFELALALAHLRSANPDAFATAVDIRDLFGEAEGFADFWNALEVETRTELLLDIADKFAPRDPSRELLAKLLLAIENPADPTESFERQYYCGELNELLAACYAAVGQERPDR